MSKDDTILIPHQLPCRQKQFSAILAFIKSNIINKNSGCLYVSGVPGTGKTLIVKTVLEKLIELSSEEVGTLPDFKNIYINGLTLTAPNRIWKRLHKELFPDISHRVSPETASAKLKAYLQQEHPPIVLVIDELDQILQDKQQSILYTLLEWTSSKANQISLVCIFNTMHLPETQLTLRNSSRMGMNRCQFPPYTHEELTAIVNKSLGRKKASFMGEGLILLSKKVAAVSGDARRAIEIAKRTLEIIDDEPKKVSSVLAVGQAFKELFSSPKIDAVKNCTWLQKQVLRSIMADLERTGSDDTRITNVIRDLISSLSYLEKTVSTDQMIQAIRNLSISKLILMESNIFSVHNRISLNVSIPDIQYGLAIK